MNCAAKPTALSTSNDLAPLIGRDGGERHDDLEDDTPAIYATK
jgi:hypothetical protein